MGKSPAAKDKRKPLVIIDVNLGKEKGKHKITIYE
jgi:hypothetical protein